MRATSGAIDQVWLQNGDLHCHVIGGPRPAALRLGARRRGAVLLQLGLIDARRACSRSPGAAPELSDALARRLLSGPEGSAFVLAYDASAPLRPAHAAGRPRTAARRRRDRAGIAALLRRANRTPATSTPSCWRAVSATTSAAKTRCTSGCCRRSTTLSIRFIGNSLTGAKRLLWGELARARALRARTTHTSSSPPSPASPTSSWTA